MDYIIIGSIILGFAVLAILIKKLMPENQDDKKELENIIREKSDIAAQVPLLKATIEESKNEKRELINSINLLNEKLVEKEVVIAEHLKDLSSHKEDIDETKRLANNLKIEKEELEKNKTVLNDNISELKNNIIQKENEISQNKLSFNKDIERLNIKNNELIAEVAEIKNNLNKSNIEIKKLTEDNSDLKVNNSKHQTQFIAQKESNEKLEKDFENQSKRLELKLNEIMQKTLDGKIKKFDTNSMKSLDDLLKPFKERLDGFKKSVDNSQENSTKKFAELSKEIEQVTKASLHISSEAENLAKALKGKKQSQGSWGEMILDSVLEYSGLIKGVHYETQESYKDDDGQTKRPDVVIKLPKDRTIIIDSKVSLNDYDSYIRATEEEEKNLYAKNISTAFKNHIDTLNSKDYAYYKTGTLQYVFMFVPIEGAFATAIQFDQSLYEYALKKHIAIVTPSTLTVSLRTIYLYWQSEQSNSLAIKLFNEAGKLYDKMVTFSTSFKKIGDQIKTVSKSYETASKQLTDGNGNVLDKVENLKQLGAKTTKTLSDAKIEYQTFEEGVNLID